MKVQVMNTSIDLIKFISKVFILCAIVTISVAQKPGPYRDLEEGPPKPYNYQYGVADEYSKANFQKTEAQDGNVRIDTR